MPTTRCYVETMTGKVLGHALKHIPKEGEGLGPTTVILKLEDELGHECKAEVVVPRAYAATRFPVGAIVSIDLRVRQIEIDFNAKQNAKEGADVKARRREAGVEDELELFEDPKAARVSPAAN